MKTYWVNRYEKGCLVDKFMNLNEQEAKNWLSLNGQYEGISFKAFDYDTFEEMQF